VNATAFYVSLQCSYDVALNLQVYFSLLRDLRVGCGRAGGLADLRIMRILKRVGFPNMQKKYMLIRVIIVIYFTLGTGDCRWVCERRAALETAVDFSTDGSVIHAGYEPLEFKTLFPYWEDHREAMEINEDKLSSTFEKELKKFEKTTYTLAELQSKPEEVDRLHLETYLSDADFEVNPVILPYGI